MSTETPKPNEPTRPAPIRSSDWLGRVSQRWWLTTLECCPPGLFMFSGSFGFKTEYSDQNGPEAYCVESGEYFWGGTNGDAHARRMLMVTPVIITPPVQRLAGPISPEHPEATCEDCGGANVVWHAPSPIWNGVVRENNNGDDVMLCPTCFVIRAEKAGVHSTSWRVCPEDWPNDKAHPTGGGE